MKKQTFTPETPPKSGNALKLWRWWEQLRGTQPRRLIVDRPGRNQRAEGAAHYVIDDRFLVMSVPDAIRSTSIEEAFFDKTTGDYIFG